MIVAALYAEPWPQLFTTINFVSKAKVLSNARKIQFSYSVNKNMSKDQAALEQELQNILEQPVQIAMGQEMTKRSLPPTQRLAWPCSRSWTKTYRKLRKLRKLCLRLYRTKSSTSWCFSGRQRRVTSVTARAVTGHVLIAATISTLSGCRVSPPVSGRTRRLLHGTRLHTRVSWRWLKSTT